MKLPIIFVSIALAISSTCYSQWTQTSGPTGGEARDIVKVNHFLVLNAGAGGVYRSEDDGSHWVAINNGLPNNPHCYAVTATGDVIYAAISTNGIYKSTDFGETWTSVGTNLQGKTFYSLLADGNDVYAGWSDGGFYYSANAGNSWSLKGNNIGQVRDFLVAGGNLFIAASASGLASVYKSSNKGTDLINMNAPVTSINGMGGYDNAIYLTGGQPIVISHDNGVTWTTTDVGAMGYYMMKSVYAYEDRVIVSGGNSTLFVSQDEGLHWETVTTLSYPGVVDAIYSENDKIIVGGLEGIYISNDNGHSWLEKNEGLKNLIITHLVATDDIAFAGTGVGVFSSEDNGLTWSKRVNGLEENSPFAFVEGIVVKGMHVTPESVIVATGSGIFKSTDDGLHWNLIEARQGTDVNTRFQVLAGDEDRLFAGENGLQHYSKSGGATWSTSDDPAFNGIGLISALVNGDTIVVMASDKILISTNFGSSWQHIRVTTDYFQPNAAAFSGNKLYIGTYHGLFATTDMKSWTKLGGLQTESVLSLSAVGNSLYAGTEKGVHVSYDKGQSWYPVNEGMEEVPVAPLVISGSNAFGGTYGRSVWHSLLNDLNVSPVITGVVSPLEFKENESLTIELANLIVLDPDNVFPADFTLVVKSGANYSVVGNVVTPDPNFSDELQLTVVVSDGHSESNEYVIRVRMITGIAESAPGFELFPNPTNQTVNFRIEGYVKSYSVTDLAGRKILFNENVPPDADTHSIDVTSLPAGVYLIELQGSNSWRQRFIKF